MALGAAEQNFAAAAFGCQARAIVHGGIRGHHTREAAIVGIGVGPGDQAELAGIGDAVLLVLPLLHALREELLPQPEIGIPFFLECFLRDLRVGISAARIEVHRFDLFAGEFDFLRLGQCFVDLGVGFEQFFELHRDRRLPGLGKAGWFNTGGSVSELDYATDVFLDHGSRRFLRYRACRDECGNRQCRAGKNYFRCSCHYCPIAFLYIFQLQSTRKVGSWREPGSVSPKGTTRFSFLIVILTGTVAPIAFSAIAPTPMTSSSMAMNQPANGTRANRSMTASPIASRKMRRPFAPALGPAIASLTAMTPAKYPKISIIGQASNSMNAKGMPTTVSISSTTAIGTQTIVTSPSASEEIGRVRPSLLMCAVDSGAMMIAKIGRASCRERV